MARKKLIEKSYRTLVGTLGPNTRFGQGTYIYDTNDSTRDYGLFALFTGMTADAERFCLDFLAEKTAPYLDSIRTADPARPAALLKEIITDLMNRLETGGFIEPNTAYHAFSIVLVKGGTAYIARINGSPIFYMKDRKFRPIYHQPKARGRESLQIESVSIDEGDRIMLSSEEMIKHPTKLELRNVLLAGEDLTLACSKIQMLATRYEEIESPRLMLIHFRRNESKSATLFNRRNGVVVAAVALFIMVLFLWGDIVRLVNTSSIGYIVTRKNIFQKTVETVTKDSKEYTLEPVYDKLAIAYDLAVDKNGVLYIVDDRESKIIRYDSKTGERKLIGDQADLAFPTGIEYNDNHIYVADFSSSVNRIFIFDGDGNYIGKIPNQKSNDIALRNPKALTVYNNNIYLCDRGNNRILVFDRDGVRHKTINVPDVFREPNGIAVTDNGVIFITLKLSGAAAKITGKAPSQFTLYEESQNNESSKVTLSKPSGIAVDGQGFVYIADTQNRRIVVANPMGRVVGIIDQDKMKDFETFYPMSVKLDPEKQYLYIVAANRYSYDKSCEGKCQSKIWRIKI
jgi:sugar lactone lactonase YvrE